MSNNVPTFETHDVDLAAFLMLSGLKFIECKKDPNSDAEKPRVLMRFFDEKQQALDLERVFTGSEFTRYRSFQKYLLKDIHRTIRGIK